MIKRVALRIRTWLERYERPLAAGAILFGFIVDSYLLTRVDLTWNNLLLLGYLVIASVGVVIFHMVEEHTWRGWIANVVASFMPIVVQFAFGSLFSGLIIFYGRSASIATSWIFVVVLAGLLLFSEAFNQNYRRFRYQIPLIFFLLLAYNAFYLPVILGMIGPFIFVASVLLSIGLMLGFLVVVSKILPQQVKRTRTFIISVTIPIAAIFVFLYAVNAIPPLPLSLEGASVAHRVTRVGDMYELLVEPKPWYAIFERYKTEYNRTPGEAVYVYSSVFAPTKLSLTLAHEWQYYDEILGAWKTVNTISFPVSGGRDGGYRGYTMKTNVTPGKWRVNVITSYGAILGRVAFTVQEVDTQPELITVPY